jgi:predicted GNAT superfamily acetyltransferase
VIAVRLGPWSQLQADAAPVRRAVFVQEQGIDEALEWDDADALSLHAVAYQGAQAIGTGRLLPDARIGRMAVLPEFRNKGVGYALKVDQWNWAKRNNYSELSWTFDPLVRRNAKLNIAKLGANISAFHPNFYGEMPDALNAGDESDRLMVSWRTDINAPKARELITDPEPGDILIEIPEDIVAIRSKNQSESMKWRRQVREQFMAAFEKNGKVIGFSANSEYVVRI